MRPTLPFIGIPHSLHDERRRNAVKLNPQEVLHIITEIIFQRPCTEEDVKGVGAEDYVLGLMDLINYHHERAHYHIFRSPCGQIIRLKYFLLHGAILTLKSGCTITCQNRVTHPEDLIVVPLNPDPSGTILEKQWAEVLFANQFMLPWEEAIAVYYSLDKAYNDRDISTKQQRSLERRLKQRYSQYFDGFAEVYDLTKKILKTSGTQGIDQMVASLLDNYSLSWREEFERSKELVLVGKTECDWLPKYCHEFPGEPLFCAFCEEGMSFLPPGRVFFYDRQRGYFEFPHSLGTRPFIENKTMNYWIMWEAVCEQLTQGVGVQCPFWFGNDCCGNREWWEWILNHTVLRKGSPGPWEPQGCLKL